MAYDVVYQLTMDMAFNNRVRSCMWQESLGHQANPDPASAALARDVLRGGITGPQTMAGMIASFPGLADGATITKGDGSVMVDQTAVADGDILAQVQANWKTVADLYYTPPPP